MLTVCAMNRGYCVPKCMTWYYRHVKNGGDTNSPCLRLIQICRTHAVSRSDDSLLLAVMTENQRQVFTHSLGEFLRHARLSSLLVPGVWVDIRIVCRLWGSTGCPRNFWLLCTVGQATTIVIYGATTRREAAQGMACISKGAATHSEGQRSSVTMARSGRTGSTLSAQRNCPSSKSSTLNRLN